MNTTSIASPGAASFLLFFGGGATECPPVSTNTVWPRRGALRSGKSTGSGSMDAADKPGSATRGLPLDILPTVWQHPANECEQEPISSRPRHPHGVKMAGRTQEQFLISIVYYCNCNKPKPAIRRSLLNRKETRYATDLMAFCPLHQSRRLVRRAWRVFVASRSRHHVGQQEHRGGGQI